MSYWIEQLGFWGYLKKFPLNPITMFCFAVVVGVFVLLINQKIRKTKAVKYLLDNQGASIMVFFKKKAGNPEYADNIRILTLDGEKPDWFFIRHGIPALYLKKGKKHNRGCFGMGTWVRVN